MALAEPLARVGREMVLGVFIVSYKAADGEILKVNHPYKIDTIRFPLI